MSHVVRLPYAAPYDWPAIRDYFAVRAIPGVETVAGSVYARTIALAGRHGCVTVGPGDGDALVATIHGPAPDAVPAIAVRLRRMFDLDADPALIRAGLAEDPHLAGLVGLRPGLRVPGAWDGFELGVRAILGQQVSVAAATRLAGKLVAAFGTPLAAAGGGPGLTHVFPTPERLARADIAAALGMPRARGGAIATLAEAVAREPALVEPGRGNDQDVGQGAGQDAGAAVAALMRLRGIGEWTAQYIAMRALRAADAMPVGDIGLLRALDRGAGRPTPAQLLRLSQAWRPWRAYAVLHLWASDADSTASAGMRAAPDGVRVGA